MQRKRFTLTAILGESMCVELINRTDCLSSRTSGFYTPFQLSECVAKSSWKFFIRRNIWCRRGDMEKQWTRNLGARYMWHSDTFLDFCERRFLIAAVAVSTVESGDSGRQKNKRNIFCVYANELYWRSFKTGADQRWWTTCFMYTWTQRASRNFLCSGEYQVHHEFLILKVEKLKSIKLVHSFIGWTDAKIK